MKSWGYHVQYAASWVCLIAVIVLGAITIADQERLGIGDALAAWLAVGLTVAGALQAFLPKIQRPPDDARTGMD